MRRLFNILIICAVVLSSCSKDEAVVHTAVDTTVYIYTEDDLFDYVESLKSDSSLSAKLMDDIVLTGTNNWMPIESFSGTFDGNGYSITGLSLSINTIFEEMQLAYTGFFAECNGATIRDLTIGGEALDFTNASNAAFGMLAGRISETTIERCSTTDDIEISAKNTNGVAGLIGRAESNSTIIDCVNRAAVKTVGRFGGIVAEAYSNVTISGCSNYGTVEISVASESNTKIGGIAGHISYSSKIINCYNHGNVIGTINDSGATFVGGVVGYMSDYCLVANCYSTGSVSGEERVGGVCGDLTSSSTLYNCYSNGSVTGTTDATKIGAVYGSCNLRSWVKACYYDSSVCELTGTTDDAEAVEVSEMPSDLVATLNANIPACVSYFPTVELNYWAEDSDVAAALDFERTPYIYKQSSWRISSKEQLTKIGTGEYLPADSYTLTTNIDLGDSEWTPLPTFCGTLNGAGYTISGLKIVFGDDTTTVNSGLFSQLQGATIKNLSIKGEVAIETTIDFPKDDPEYRFGLLAGVSSSSTISNCTIVKGSKIESTGDFRFYGGAVVGKSFGDQLSNVSSYAEIDYSSRGYIAGIASYVYGSTLKSCLNDGDIKATADVAGVVCNSYMATLDSCLNSGEVYSSGATFIAGVVGYASETVVTDCTNRGGVDGGSGSRYVAGVVASLSADSEIYNAANYGAIKGEMSINRVGGILASCDILENYSYSISPLNDCVNYGSVEGVKYVGGIIGSITSNTSTYEYDCEINSCVNSGTVTASGDYAAGVAGYVTTNVIFDNCINNEVITGTSSDYTAQIYNKCDDDAIIKTNDCLEKGSVVY